MSEQETTIKLKKSTKSRLRDARRTLSNILNITLMSDDATLDALINDWVLRSGDNAGTDGEPSTAPASMVQQRLV